MSKSSPNKYNNKKWLLSKFEKLRYKKDMFGGSFFSVLLLTFFFFIMPLPKSIENNIFYWRVSMFVFFFVVIVGWYWYSTKYFKFCVDILNFQHSIGNFPRNIKGKVTKYSFSQILFSLILALILPFVLISFFEHKIHLETFYFVFFGFASICTVLFLMKIESFYDKREKLDEIEILTESFIYHDPLDVINSKNGKVISLNK